jgi:hypothetical protein
VAAWHWIDAISSFQAVAQLTVHPRRLYRCLLLAHGKFERVLFYFYFHFEQALERNRYSVQELVRSSPKHQRNESRVGSSHLPTRTGGPDRAGWSKLAADARRLIKPWSPVPNVSNCDRTVSVLVSRRSFYLTTRPSFSV